MQGFLEGEGGKGKEVREKGKKSRKNIMRNITVARREGS